MNLTQQNPGVLLASERRAERRCDISRREPSRGDLIEQRLKEMKIAPVEKGDFDGNAS
jgi:hypothetical protein